MLNNIKQLGLALNSYHTAYGKFPPSSVWRSGGNFSTSGIESGNNGSTFENWVILILPQLDQMNLRQAFTINSSTPTTNSVNAAAVATNLSVMQCPSDTYNRTAFVASTDPSGSLSAFGSSPWARGDYGANAAMGYMATSGHSDILDPKGNPLGNGAGTGWNSRWCRGVMGANVSLRIDDIKDGASNTILVGEIRAGLTTFDPRGVWAWGGGCPSALLGSRIHHRRQRTQLQPAFSR